MYETILNFFLSRPRRLVLMGQALLKIAGFAFVAGLIGRAVTAGLASVRNFQATEPGVLPLTALFPNLPTWWVPETILGFTAAAMLALMAVAMAKMGRKLERYQ